MILAAFRPDTKAFLRDTGLIAPTVQMVYRRARVGVRSRAAYLSGGAHPSVFRASDISLGRMIGLANAIAPDAVPPMVRLQMLQETVAQEGTDYFGDGLSEVLFDTPSAIARIWRSRQGRRSMVVSAADTSDPNGRDLQFEWVVLRGDPAKVTVTVTPLTPNGSHAHISLDWQDPLPVPGAPDIISSRIDIGVFANNGVYDSAPAFISVLLPHHETRIYQPGPGGVPRIVSLDRSLANGFYADPGLFPKMPWRDDYRYDAVGLPTGWTRHSTRKDTEETTEENSTAYTSVGHRILTRDGAGAPLETVPVRYVFEQKKDARPRLREQPVAPVAKQ